MRSNYIKEWLLVGIIVGRIIQVQIASDAQSCNKEHRKELNETKPTRMYISFQRGMVLHCLSPFSL